MTKSVANPLELIIDIQRLSEGEREELHKLGILSRSGELQEYGGQGREPAREPSIIRQAIQAPSVLNEAYHYAKPASFSRGLRVDIGGISVLFISGTASVDEHGRSVHIGDFGAQCWRTYRNIATLLASEGATWHDVVRTTCYLRDIERDYGQFNQIRTSFFQWLGLDPLPASVGVQARLCRGDLLVEIEAIALFQAGRDRAQQV